MYQKIVLKYVCGTFCNFSCNNLPYLHLWQHLTGQQCIYFLLPHVSEGICSQGKGGLAQCCSQTVQNYNFSEGIVEILKAWSFFHIMHAHT